MAVLTESDWKKTIENPYGVPGVRDPDPIAFMPADVEAGVLYRDVFAIADGLSRELRTDIDARCGSLRGCTAKFADLIVLHEIGHVYVDRTRFGRPNMWLTEFAADYLAYAYLREAQHPDLMAWNIMNTITARIAPTVGSLEEFERQRATADGFKRLEPELPRLHGILMEHIPLVYERVGSAFISRMVDAFPRQEHPSGCRTEGLSAGICESQELPEAEILRRLEAIAPGFSNWAQRYGDARR